MYFISQEENDIELYPLEQERFSKTYTSGRTMCFIRKNLNGKYFQYKDFSETDFSNMNISYTIFDNCIMSDAKFENTRFNSVSFYNCTFTTDADWLDGSGFIKRFPIKEFNRYEIRYCNDTRKQPFYSSGKYNIISSVVGIKTREYLKTDFIGYKILGVKNFNKAVASLLIRPRNGTVIYKNDVCRCAQAVVLKIEGIDGRRYESGFSYRQPRYASCLTYTVGETVFPDCFDGSWDKVGSHGIHFCLTKKEAWNA